MEPEPQEKRLRVQSSRSTNGCQTCKHRRIKCDEGRPQCQRCLKAGRQCEYVADGYHASSRKFVIYSVSRELSTTPDLDTSETRALHYFRCRAASQITAPFQSILWKECIFRLAERYDFVMSALVALSTMHESYSQEADSRARLQADANRQYNKAMKTIRQATASELPIDAVLIAIIVFHSLESLRGCYQTALQHAQSGLKLVGGLSRASSSQQVATLNEALYRDFLALQNQVREFGHSSMIKAYDTNSGFEPPPCDGLESVDEALHHLGIIYNEIYCVMDHCQQMQEANIVLHEVFDTEIRPGYEQIMVRFNKWVLGMGQLEVALDDSDVRQKQGFLVLSMYQSAFSAMLNSFLRGDCFDGYNVDIARAVELAERFLHADVEPEGQRPFSLYIGVIPILFAISWRSCAGAIRDKSLELLRLADRREGVWDSTVAFKLAQRVIALKDQLAASGARVQIDEISFDSELTCQLACTIVGPEAGVTGDLLPFEGAVGERRHVERVGLNGT